MPIGGCDPLGEPRGQGKAKRPRRALGHLHRERARLPIAPQGAGQHVHRRRAHEARDEEVDRIVVDLSGFGHLTDMAVIHHRDPGRQRHRLDLVVGDIDDGLAEPLVQLLDLGAHLDPQLGVEVRQGFVEQEDLGLAHKRAAHRDALALAARKLTGLAVQIGMDLQKRAELFDRGGLFGARDVAGLHPEGDVLAHRLGRVERVGLEHHRDVAVARRGVVDQPPGDLDMAVAQRLEPGDQVEQGGLAAARGPDEDDEFARLDLEVDALDHLVGPEAFAHALKGNSRCHCYPFTAPAESPRTNQAPATT